MKIINEGVIVDTTCDELIEKIRKELESMFKNETNETINNFKNDEELFEYLDRKFLLCKPLIIHTNTKEIIKIEKSIVEVKCSFEGTSELFSSINEVIKIDNENKKVLFGIKIDWEPNINPAASELVEYRLKEINANLDYINQEIIKCRNIIREKVSSLMLQYAK